MQPTRPNESDLHALASSRGSHRVSLFVPLDRREPPRSPLHLKNLMEQAREQLEDELGVDATLQLFAPARSLLNWVTPLKGEGTLALFLSPTGEHGRFLIDETISPRVVVDDAFCIRPLAEAAPPGPFIVLCLSQQQVRAYASTSEGMTEMQLRDLPRNGLDDIPGAEAEHHDLQHHTQGTRGPAIHHGHRDDTKGEDERLARLCKTTVKALQSSALPSPPIVVAATERLAAHFRRQSRGLSVVGELAGNHENTPLSKLRDEASSLLAEHQHERVGELGEALQLAIAQGRGAKDVGDVVVAAFDGRVDTLFIDRDAERWGTLDPAARSVEVHAEPRDGDRELIDMAVHFTLRHGGDVVPYVPLDDRPGVAAIHRHA